MLSPTIGAIQAIGIIGIGILGVIGMYFLLNMLFHGKLSCFFLGHKKVIPHDYYGGGYMCSRCGKVFYASQHPDEF